MIKLQSKFKLIAKSTKKLYNKNQFKILINNNYMNSFAYTACHRVVYVSRKYE